MHKQDELLILMAECIGQLEYVSSRNGGDTSPFKQLKELTKEIKFEEADKYTPLEFEGK
jgi:hypothetical protein